MRRHLDPLVADSFEFLLTLRDFVRHRGLVGIEDGWREVVRSFGDGHGFLDLSARHDSGRVRVLIDFGVEHQGERHCVGFFDAYWNAPGADFGQIVAVALYGESVDLDGLSVAMQSYLILPLMRSEAALAG